jgi:hypothetical protein
MTRMQRHADQAYLTWDFPAACPCPGARPWSTSACTSRRTAQARVLAQGGFLHTLVQRAEAKRHKQAIYTEKGRCSLLQALPILVCKKLDRMSVNLRNHIKLVVVVLVVVVVIVDAYMRACQYSVWSAIFHKRNQAPQCCQDICYVRMGTMHVPGMDSHRIG